MIKSWFGLQMATKEKYRMNLSKTGNVSVKWVLDLPEPRIHTHTHIHTPPHSLLHNQRYCSSFLKRRRQVQHSKWQFCCQIRKHTEQQQNEIHTLTSALIRPHGREVVRPPEECGFQSSRIWPTLQGGGGGGGGSTLEV